MNMMFMILMMMNLQLLNKTLKKLPKSVWQTKLG